MFRTSIVLAALLLTAGCGEDEVASTPAAPEAPAIRMAEFEGRIAKCEAGEMILNAYCFVKPGASFSPSSVIFAEEEDGSLEAECMSGGRNIRIFCVRK